MMKFRMSWTIVHSPDFTSQIKSRGDSISVPLETLLLSLPDIYQVLAGSTPTHLYYSSMKVVALQQANFMLDNGSLILQLLAVLV